MNTPIVIYCNTPINEVDSRAKAHGNIAGTSNQGPGGFYGTPDWRVWDGASYGKQVQREANPGQGYTIDVHDCGQHLSVTASYQNPANGKKVSQSFIIVLQGTNNSAGTVFMTSTKWRTVSSISQAASYISSTIRSMAGSINQR